ncbi:MAG: metallophosphoesterase [Bacilli bacterium]
MVKGYDFYSKIDKEKYVNYLDETIQRELAHLPIFKQDQNLYKTNKMQEVLPIVNYINKNEYLRELNLRRTRNFIIYKNSSMELVFDSFHKELSFVSKSPFSDIEHDTNRKFTEEICIDILLDFKKSKQKFIKMLSKPYDKSYTKAYKKYIAILNGKSKFTDEDIIIMISILGRLNQEKRMGPISVQKDYKLNPNKIANHKTLQKYIVACVSTIKEYTNFYLLNQNEFKQLGNISFNGKLNKSKITPSFIPLLSYNNQGATQIQITEQKVIGNVYMPNYIESFFRKITELPEFAKLPIFIDDYKDVMVEFTNYAKRYDGNINPDFIILAKIKSIILYKKFSLLMRLIEKKILGASTRQTYYRKVAETLLSINDESKQKAEFFKLLSIYENHIAFEIKRFIMSRSDNVNSEFNEYEISISSDLHFNDMKDIAKENFSKNFNIIAGDFYNNTYHRAGAKITESSDIVGIGVLGNHDVNWIDGVNDIKKEIKTNYTMSINNLKSVFPNVKILNNEVQYLNGIAFVGLTMVTDEDGVGKRSFFNNKDLGKLFSKEDYINQAKILLDSVDSGIPIVVISHSPFKEYAVCKNKEIGIHSDKLFAQYPNIKVYIHGHGHSRQNSQIIDNILCITNPLVRNIYTDSSLSCQWNDLSCYDNNSLILLDRLS